MPAPENILIVSASIGSGHLQAAKAIEKQIQSQYSHINTHLVDFTAEENSYLNFFIKEAYLKMINISPNIYDLLYHWTHSSSNINMGNMLARIMKKSMQRLIDRYQPDIIICTHPFPCIAAAYLKKLGKTSATLAAVVTDFAIHKLWVYQQVDAYFVAHDEMRASLLAEGILRERIHVTGIPIIHTNLPFDRQTIIRHMGLDEKYPIVLLMGGGLGLGGIQEALNHLNQIQPVLQLVVVAGKNAALQHSLNKEAILSTHKVKVLGYAQNIQEWMACANLLVTKPGALTISEALTAGLPMLLYQPIPGQEEENAAFINSKEAGIWIKKNCQLAKCIETLLDHPDRLAFMKVKAQKIARPLAAFDIIKILVMNDDQHSKAAGI